MCRIRHSTHRHKSNNPTKEKMPLSFVIPILAPGIFTYAAGNEPLPSAMAPVAVCHGSLKPCPSRNCSIASAISFMVVGSVYKDKAHDLFLQVERFRTGVFAMNLFSPATYHQKMYGRNATPIIGRVRLPQRWGHRIPTLLAPAGANCHHEANRYLSGRGQ
jgi:hypothetical protein